MVVLLLVVARDGREELERQQPVEAPRASPAEAASALSAFVDGVRRRDRDALVQLAPPSVPSADELLAGVAANVRSLDLTAVTARYLDQVGTVAPDGSWSGVAQLTWQVRGFDDAPARSEVVVRFAPSGDALGIAGFDPRGTDGVRLPLWLRGPLAVARTDDVLAMVDGTRREAELVAARARTGIGVVQRVLPDWEGPVVVEVPATAADLDATLGAERGEYAGIAAVTAPVGDPSDTRGPVHVFVNPEVTDGLRRVGAQVVMSHELVHVATDAVRKPVESWLMEGFADYIALRDTRVPDRVTLGRAIAVAKRDGVPRSLPAAGDFDTRGPDLQARYEEAWLGCRILARRVDSEVTLVKLYSQVQRGLPLPGALRRIRVDESALTRAWRDQLRRLTLRPQRLGTAGMH